MKDYKECNKDEAVRAKEIAERRFDAKDFVGAKKFAQKAQDLYPPLDGISQMVATFDVYVCASTKTNGETDWYNMLDVTPSADGEIIRKQYRKLALTLHPDKNKSVGAEGAFQFISEAWGLLSDKDTRASYDQRRSSNVSHSKSTVSQAGTVPSRANSFTDKDTRASYDQRRSSNVSHSKSTVSQAGTAPSRANSFTDKDTRASYDQRRSSNVSHSKSTVSQSGTAPFRANSFTDFSKPTASKGRVNNEASWGNTTLPEGYLNFSKLAASSGSVNNIASWGNTASSGDYFNFSKSAASSGSGDNKASWGNTAPPGVIGFNEYSKSTASRFRVDNSSTCASNLSTSGTAQKANPNSFWTECSKCHMRYEYLRKYLNQYLACPNCQQDFLAEERSAPVSSSSLNSSQQQRSDAMSGAFGDGSNEARFQQAPFSQGTTSKFVHAASGVQQRYGRAEGECEEALAANWRDEDIKRKYNASENASTEYINFANKKRGIEEAGLNSFTQRSLGAGYSTSTASIRHGSSETFQMNRTKNVYGIRELTQNQIREILIEKAKAVIHKKISEVSSIVSKDATLRDKAEEKAHHDYKGKKHAEVFNQKKILTSIGRSSNAMPGNDISAADDATSESLSISVPDSDFYDFDKDRTEKSFEENQVWAAYDTDDGMPRFYAVIKSVLSRDPFKVQISWFNPKSNTELGSLDWVGSGFSKTCGHFRVSRYEISDSLNSFSHTVKWSKGARGLIHIFPSKGDVWALYRNWSPDWNKDTPADVIRKYDMVEVLEDYDEEVGVVVTPLVKVAGFKMVYRHLDLSQIRRIPREEMFQLSHQVPSHLLTAEEASDALKGCMELDPAAAPVELPDVIADVKGDIMEAANDDENLTDQEKASEKCDTRQ